MPKVIFNIQYEIPPEKKEEYLSVIKELKNLLNPEGLESYSVYETKGKNHHYQEQYTFNSVEAYEAEVALATLSTVMLQVKILSW